MKKTLLILSLIATIAITFFACSEERDHTNPLDTDYWGSRSIIPVKTFDLTSTSIDQINLSWTLETEYHTGYKFRIDKKVGSGVWQNSYKLLLPSQLNYTDTAEMNQTLYYRIMVSFDENVSDYVEKNYDNIFQAPTNLTSSKVDLNTIKLEWMDNSAGETGFKIDKKIGEGDWVEGFAAVAGNINTWTDNGAEINKNLQYRVYAYKGNDSSNSVSTQLIDNTFPAPTGLFIDQTSLTSANLTWTDNSIGEEKFEIERKLSAESNYVKIAEIAGSNTGVKYYTDSVVPTLTYNYRIRGVKNTDSSAYKTETYTSSFHAPTNLNVTQTSITSANLTWTDNCIGEEKFEIERKLSTESTYIKIAEVSGSDSATKTWTDTTVEPGYTYDYRVKAKKDIYNSGYATITNYTNTFSAPTNFTATQNNVYTFTLNWTDSNTGEDGFKVERKIDDGTYTEIATLPANTVSFIDDTVSKKGYGTVYYQIRAYKGTYYTNYTQANSAVSFPAPTNIAYSKPDITTVTLTWTDNSDGEEGFYIDKKIEGENWGRYATLNADTETWSDTTAEINTNIYYSVYAYKGSNTTEHLNSPTINTTFPAPTNFNAVQNNVYTFTLNWTDNSIGEDGFKIERKIDDGIFTEIATTTTTAFIDSTVAKKGYGTVYYQVRAYKGTTYFSAYTQTNSAVSFPAPTNLTVTQLDITSANLSWTDNSIGEEKFEIERRLSTESTYIKVAEVLGNDMAIKSYIDTTLEPGEIYDYRVKAIKGLNSSEYITKTDFINTFNAPTGLTANVEFLDSIQLDWSDNSNGEDGFKIDRKVGTGGTWETDYATVGANIKTFTNTGLTTDITYFYRVRAYYSTYYSSYTSEESNKISDITRFASIPIGSFSMGQTDVAAPVHTVNITRPYFLGKYEVTQREWQTLMFSNPASDYGVGDNFPVYSVNVRSIIEYCNKRSIREGLTPCYTISGSTNPGDWGTETTWNEVTCNFSAKGYRLPTEAEWEYAARYNDDRIYPWGYTSPSSSVCNYNSNVGATTVVGSYPLGNSILGLCDMAGNVWEWVWDWHDPNYYQYCVDNNITNDPSGPDYSIDDQYRKVIRGGGWEEWLWNPTGVNSTHRVASWCFFGGVSSGDKTNRFGFRLSRTK